MNFFNRQKTRTPADTVKGLRDNITRLDHTPAGEGSKKVRYWEIVKQLRLGASMSFGESV